MVPPENRVERANPALRTFAGTSPCTAGAGAGYAVSSGGSAT
jgi:hypothetical protein